jgi:hypothetical protein
MLGDMVATYGLAPSQAHRRHGIDDEDSEDGLAPEDKNEKD